ncbi:hypothetical protein [Natronococcus sp. A-GB7]|uniref:hypothetical protein n=1 Tax=Natronococcus sp. A-GB7 TaxID=3037649 RepID=UPI00241E103F|nr:hypothetical protein [Natronococcus sp. A-GB7]MDG5818955.1 hypothetical protein [Natronococcus sp. A-GB7]
MDRSQSESTTIPDETESLDEESELPPRGEPDSSIKNDEDGIDTILAVVSVGMGLIVGMLVALAFAEIGGFAFWFLVTIVGVSYYLYSRKESPRSAIGSGLYITAIWLILAPLLFYMGLAGGADPDTAAGTGQAVGSILGMVVWGFIGLLLAIVVGAVGYFVNRSTD